MIRKVYEWPSPELRKVAAPVTVDQQPQVKQLIDDLFETMHSQKGVGLSATQCGVPLQVLVYSTNYQLGGKEGYLINPRIVDCQGQITSQEGCLSFPGCWAAVNRHEKIVVESLDLTINTTLTQDFWGMESIIIQHEMDHLKGVVFLDHLKPVKRSRVINKLKKIQRAKKS